MSATFAAQQQQERSQRPRPLQQVSHQQNGCMCIVRSKHMIATASHTCAGAMEQEPLLAACLPGQLDDLHAGTASSGFGTLLPKWTCSTCHVEAVFKFPHGTSLRRIRYFVHRRGFCTRSTWSTCDFDTCISMAREVSTYAVAAAVQCSKPTPCTALRSKRFRWERRTVPHCPTACRTASTSSAWGPPLPKFSVTYSLSTVASFAAVQCAGRGASGALPASACLCSSFACQQAPRLVRDEGTGMILLSGTIALNGTCCHAAVVSKLERHIICSVPTWGHAFEAAQ